MFCWKKTLLSLSAGMYFGFAQAANVAVPAPLEPWKQWVLDSHKELTCPSHYANLGERYCRWPGKLQLQADAHGAGFSQEWHLYNEGWVALPGDTDNWPQDVR